MEKSKNILKKFLEEIRTRGGWTTEELEKILLEILVDKVGEEKGGKEKQ